MGLASGSSVPSPAVCCTLDSSPGGLSQDVAPAKRSPLAGQGLWFCLRTAEREQWNLHEGEE